MNTKRGTAPRPLLSKSVPLLGALGLLWLLCSEAARAQSNMVLLNSPAGEYIGQGQTYYTTTQADVAISGTPAAVTIVGLGFTNTFAGPGQANLTIGQYSNAVQYPFNGNAPGLNVSTNGRTCTNICGSFQIYEIQTDTNGQLIHFWATFSQKCECNIPPLTGEVRYNSLLAPTTVLPRTLRVPGDFLTIQSALDDVSTIVVDTVLVDPGVYPGPVQFGRNSAHLVSVAGPSVTTIVGPSDGPAVSFTNPAPDMLLCGFTVSNSLRGVSITGGATPLILSNLVVDCQVGIESPGSSAVIRENHVISCPGGGISVWGTAAAVVEGNLIEQNGDGIVLAFAGAPTIRNNTIRDNSGIGVNFDWQYLPTEDPNVTQNLILNNTGHGVYFSGGGRGPWIINNTIVGNGGAGIAKDGSAPDVRIMNNIVLGDPALLFNNDATPATIQFNDFYSRTGAAVSGLVTNLTGIGGNISADPFFACEPGWDLRPVAASPCIDAGTNGVPLLTATDLGGQPRILAGATNGSANIDIGAFELDPSNPPSPCLFLQCPTNIVVMAPPGQQSAPVSFPGPFATPGATVTAVPASGSSFSAGDNTVIVEALFGTNVTNCTFTVTVITDHDLARALDATNLPWVSFGDASWFAEGAVNHDGIAAAQSGALTNIGTSTLSTVLSGPGTLSFWWKLSSALGYDTLYLYVDGAAAAGIAGVVDWQFQSVDLAPGPHIVDWKLARGESTLTGQVAGWLDQVTFPPGPTPLVLVCPSNQVVVAPPGQYAAVVNFPTPFATPGATVTVTPTNGSVFPGGDSLVNVSAVYGTDTTNCSFTVTLRTAQDLPLGLNTTNIDWTTAGQASWYLETNVSHDGIAAQSGAITNGQLSTVQTTLTGPGTLSFWWKVSSAANHGLLSASVNRGTQATISGQVDWQPQTVYLGSGTQLVQFIYAKDASGTAGQDAGWIDQVSWSPGPVASTITVQPADVAQAPGLPAAFAVTAAGIPPLTYQWQFNGHSIPGATDSLLVITNVQATNVGTYRVLVLNQVGTAFSTNATLTLAQAVAWGVNNYGQTNVPINLTNVAQVAGGWHHSVALRTDSTVVAWGDDNAGQTNVPAGLSNVVAIASRSGDHSMALKADGTLVVWGDNSSGQRNVPPGLSNVVAIAAGGSHCLALKADGTAVSWGYLKTVPAGLSNVVAVSAGDSASLFLKADATLAGVGTTIPANVTNIVAIAAGGQHNLALRADGTVLAWGNNSYGQTSIPSGLSNVVAIAAGDWHSTALIADGTVAVWGKYFTGSTYIPPIVPAGLTNALAIAAGSDHDLAFFGNGSPPPSLKLLEPNWTAGQFSVSVPTQNGRAYRLEYKDSLTDPTWTGLYMIAGNGGSELLSDSVPPTAQRFYRVSRW